MQEMKDQLARLQALNASTNSEISELEKRKVEYSCRIMQAEKMCSELVVFEPSDLILLRDQYAVSTLTQLWRPTHLSKSKNSWLYDEAIQLSVSTVGNQYQLNYDVFVAPDNDTVYLSSM
jgi:hypothetical protein